MDKWINKNITPPPIDQPIEVKDLISKKIKIASFFPYTGEWHEINSDDTIGDMAFESYTDYETWKKQK